ncbi:CLUMA_CG008813, isoform A [Clunio marinus]|uniref:CLUMA_CG008813, isoform A n=1 Tax=Clunio marinus TaxID=568069 RepID=A0A1J1I4F3_9DIPT|nr:CLUMA_CG008813, isoform A [Clunio marinus]
MFTSTKDDASFHIHFSFRNKSLIVFTGDASFQVHFRLKKINVEEIFRSLKMLPFTFTCRLEIRV